MKTRDERIQDYAARKGITILEAHERLLKLALDVIDARRKGGKRTGNRPQQAQHLATARKIRAK